MAETDLIGRQAAIDATWFEPSYTDPLNVLTEVRDRLKALPSVTPASKPEQSCEDAVSRKAVVEYIKNSYSELGYDRENELVVEDILTMPSVKPVACIATVKFSKEDMRELIDEKMKDIVVERKKGK